ncbi:insulinase family protein [Sphingobacterium shayense]|uniref:M16 family metallopeptidase n=1 Tax=Sphingobacterium shayense TaxID=626343 RepID=UPI00155459A1|nr:pitrilysin family protein [Sphingobacterium shayense]NQD72598.1 insulinase family protein [Sphingobacterium shayense]
MISYQQFKLENGLRILVHEDHTSAMACVNILYQVGSRDESPEKTGFAHLFEHLMFGGSVNIPSFDTPLQEVGGENNAFTSTDITNYYLTLPAVNIETAFWLESDRMLSLAFSEQSLEVQRNVVCEEFKQRYLTQPYGDVWLRLRPLAYKVHPYRWATIGKDLKHIEEATMDDVKAFFKKFYTPNNAIMVITGNVELQSIKKLAEKWFAPIPAGEDIVRNLPKEPKQKEARRDEIYADVPIDSIHIAFHGPDKLHPDYPAMDLISDILSRGSSSRLYRNLVKDNPFFSEINAFVMGTFDDNLFVVEGKPSANVTVAQAEELIWAELIKMTKELVHLEELQKIKNKIESTMIFSELSIQDKAANLAFYEALGDANLYNQEVENYQAVSSEDIKRVAQYLFLKENSSTLIYHAKNTENVG